MAASLKSGFFLGSGSPQPTEKQNNPKTISKERRFRVTKNSFIKRDKRHNAKHDPVGRTRFAVCFSKTRIFHGFKANVKEKCRRGPTRRLAAPGLECQGPRTVSLLHQQNES